MGRNRIYNNKTLPPNLYLGIKGYYKYRRPDSGAWHSMGKDKANAVAAAKQLNSMLMDGRDLVEKVMGNSTLFNDFLDKFETKIMAERGLAEKTTNDYKNKLVHIRNDLGKKPIDEISVLEIADFLEKFPAVQSKRYRSLLSTIFRYAVARGLCNDNPAEKTIPENSAKKRKRLTLEGYKAIYNHGEAEPWFKNAIDIALQTLQRREDVVKMQFSDIRDGFLFVIQTKTEKHGEAAYIKIKINSPLKQVIDRCRDDTLSPYLIHRMPERLSTQNRSGKQKKHITQVTPDYLTKTFAKIRDQIKMFKNMPSEERPTFHEIRALGIKLYEDKGIDAQNLAGHTTREMTEQYMVGHEIQWTEAAAGIDFD